MKILWSSNAIWCNSGYGVQAKHLLPRLADLGHLPAQHAWYGLQGGMQKITLQTPKGKILEMPIYPMGFELYGNDIVEAHAEHFQADIVVSLMDVWVLKEYGKKKMRWIPYMPIDMETEDQEPPEIILKCLEGAFRVISYSRYGEKLLNNAGVANVMIPHGVDTKMYTPRDRDASKKKLGFSPTDYIVGMVAANKGFPSRKAFPENLQAVKNLKARHPNIKLYLHTFDGTQMGGVDLTATLQQFGFTQDDVRFVNQYQYHLGLSENYMADAYNAMDVLLAASMSEGFGIPLIEAQACGTPVIVTRFSSMPELCFGGYIAEVAQRFWNPLNAWMAIPSVDSITEGLEWAYQHRNDAGLRQKARDGAMDYDWDVIVENGWKPLLEAIAEQIKAEKVTA